MKRGRSWGVVLIVALLMAGCSKAKPIGLALVGYNYTNRKIASFYVTDERGNQAGGAPVLLSSPDSGGSGSVCCVMLNPNTTTPTRIDVHWTIDRVQNQDGVVIAPEQEKEAWVTVSPPFPSDPAYFEIHFYPDGHVEAAVTHFYSDPRIKLPEDRKVLL